MVQVTNKKGETLYRMRGDPGTSFIFRLYRYGSRKRQSCDTINTHTHDITTASGTTRESGSNPNANPDSHFYAHAKTKSHAKTYTATDAAASHSDSMPRREL
jgi:hypothetical protein